jgi:hypothetical protein
MTDGTDRRAMSMAPLAQADGQRNQWWLMAAIAISFNLR